MEISKNQFTQPLLYQLMTAGITPRPIAWISTINREGLTNLAPYSFFTVASVNPPVLCVTQVNPRDKSEKDTLTNLRQTGECVVNIVTATDVNKMNASCADYPYGVSEFTAAEIPVCQSQTVATPGVATAPIRFECRLKEVISFGNQPGAGKMMFLEVLHIAVSEDMYADGQLMPARLATVGKMAGDAYCQTGTTFELTRPQLPTDSR